MMISPLEMTMFPSHIDFCDRCQTGEPYCGTAAAESAERGYMNPDTCSLITVVFGGLIWTDFGLF